MDFRGTAEQFSDILTAARSGSEPLSARPVLGVSRRHLGASGAHLGTALAPAWGAEMNVTLITESRRGDACRQLASGFLPFSLHGSRGRNPFRAAS